MDGPPPLEDMTEILTSKRAAVFGTQEQKKMDYNSLSDSRIENVYQSSKLNILHSAPTQQPTSSTGLKKGFFNNQSKSKDQLIEVKKSAKPKNSLVLDEVQTAMKEAQQQLKDNQKQWLTPDLLENIEKDQELANALADPRFAQCMQQMSSGDPTVCEQVLKQVPDLAPLLTRFAALLAKHYDKIANKQVKETELDPHEKALIDRVLSNPKVTEALRDPRIQNILSLMRTNPDAAQGILRQQGQEIQEKLRLLTRVGLLQIQS